MEQTLECRILLSYSLCIYCSAMQPKKNIAFIGHSHDSVQSFPFCLSDTIDSVRFLRPWIGCAVMKTFAPGGIERNWLIRSWFVYRCQCRCRRRRRRQFKANQYRWFMQQTFPYLYCVSFAAKHGCRLFVCWSSATAFWHGRKRRDKQKTDYGSIRSQFKCTNVMCSQTGEKANRNWWYCNFHWLALWHAISCATGERLNGVPTYMRYRYVSCSVSTAYALMVSNCLAAREKNGSIFHFCRRWVGLGGLWRWKSLSNNNSLQA